MKRILWTITAVGALAVPVGIATAQADDDLTEPDPPTTIECDRDQLRLRDGTGDQQRTHERLNATECDGGCERNEVRNQYRLEEGQGAMERHQYRVESCDDCTGDQARVQDRTEVQDGVEDGTDPGQPDTRRYRERDHEPGVGNEDAPGRGGR